MLMYDNGYLNKVPTVKCVIYSFELGLNSAVISLEEKENWATFSVYPLIIHGIWKVLFFISKLVSGRNKIMNFECALNMPIKTTMKDSKF